MARKTEKRVAGAPATGKKVYYLRKAGTNLVFIRTALLAKRADMIPISAAEAQKRIGAQKGDSRKRVEAYRAWKEQGGHGKPPHLKQQDAEKTQQIEDGLIPPGEGEESGAGEDDSPADPLADMGMAELVALAAEKKVAVEESATEESLRAELSLLMSTDADEQAPAAPEAAE